MTDTIHPIEVLIVKNQLGTLSAEEKKQLDTWLQHADNKRLFEKLTNPQNTMADLREFHMVMKEVDFEEAGRKLSTATGFDFTESECK